MVRTAVGSRVRINFYFDEQVFEALKRIAVLKNVTYSELIRTACHEYVVREAVKAVADQKLITEVNK
jgi:hypothetical protein